VTTLRRATWRAVPPVVAFTLALLATAIVGAASALAASPSPGVGVGDPRSSGQGPGLVGDPGFAVLAVVAIGLGTVAITLAWVRLTARRDA
jgi:purine-cytosine permease-like protein